MIFINVGIWFSLCRFINVAGIIINGLIIAYTSTWSERVLINSTQRLIFFVSFEVILKMQNEQINKLKQHSEEINVNQHYPFVDILNISGNEDCFDDQDNRGK